VESPVILFILGAGASFPSGVPLMASFLARSREVWKSRTNHTDDSVFQLVFEQIEHLVGIGELKEPENIESVFTAFERSSQSADRIQALRSVIARTIEQSQLFPRRVGDGLINPPEPYRTFRDLLEWIDRRGVQPVVVSLNYDIGLDFSLFRLTTNEPCYHLTRQQPASGIPLLKLHGSLNWARCQNQHCEAVTPFILKRKTYSYGPSKSANHVLIPFASELESGRCRSCGAALTNIPFLVPPVHEKSQFFPMIQVVHDTAGEMLKRARMIFAVGYSLPVSDGYLGGFIAEHAQDEGGYQLLVCNPNPRVLDRFREMFNRRRVSHVADHFDDAAISEMKRAIWRSGVFGSVLTLSDRGQQAEED